MIRRDTGVVRAQFLKLFECASEGDALMSSIQVNGKPLFTYSSGVHKIGQLILNISFSWSLGLKIM